MAKRFQNELGLKSDVSEAAETSVFILNIQTKPLLGFT